MEPEVLQAAKNGFSSLLEVSRGKDFNTIFRSFGFDYPEQARNLTLGTPLLVRWVRLDRLKTFVPDKNDPDQLLEPTFQVLFPILSQGHVITSLSVSFFANEKRWKVAQWGGKRVIRGLTQLEQYKKSTSIFAVWIPALRMHFLAQQNTGQLALIPIADDPRFNFKAGQTLSAREVFGRLQELIPPSTYEEGRRE